MQSKCPLVNISKLSRIREKRDFGFGGPKKKKKKERAYTWRCCLLVFGERRHRGKKEWKERHPASERLH